MVLQNSLASGYPLVAWSPVVDFANWVQKNQMVKASVDGKKNLVLPRSTKFMIHFTSISYRLTLAA